MIRILLVDDDPTVRDALEFVLTEAGYSVTTAHDGLSAATLARRSHFDAVVTDYEMPDKNGVDLVNELAADGIIGDRSVVLITGAAYHAHDRLIAGTLHKPFDTAELLGLLATMVRDAAT